MEKAQSKSIDKADARKLVKSISRGLHVCANNDEIVFRFAGRLFDIEKERAERYMQKGVDLAIKILGKREAVKEFKRYNISIESKV